MVQAGHLLDVPVGAHGSDGRRGAEAVQIHGSDFIHRVHHEAREDTADAGDEDPGDGGRFNPLQAEPGAEIHHRHDLAAQIQHAVHKVGRPGHGRDLAHHDDLADFVQAEAVALGAQVEDHQFEAGHGLLGPGVVEAESLAHGGNFLLIVARDDLQHVDEAHHATRKQEDALQVFPFRL